MYGIREGLGESDRSAQSLFATTTPKGAAVSTVSAACVIPVDSPTHISTLHLVWYLDLLFLTLIAGAELAEDCFGWKFRIWGLLCVRAFRSQIELGQMADGSELVADHDV